MSRKRYRAAYNRLIGRYSNWDGDTIVNCSLASSVTLANPQ